MLRPSPWNRRERLLGTEKLELDNDLKSPSYIIVKAGIIVCVIGLIVCGIMM